MQEPPVSELQSYKLGNLQVVQPTGRLDHSQSDDFHRAMTMQTNNALRDRLHVVVDLSQVPFLSSMILKVIRSQKLRLAEQGQSICLCNPSAVVREILGIAKFQLVAPLYDSIDDAAAALAESP